ncbi:MAG: hypothetical protein NC236_01560 [Mycoplasma sp.]|nr:hypothetical protein [Mycoplasma sp.]
MHRIFLFHLKQVFWKWSTIFITLISVITYIIISWLTIKITTDSFLYSTNKKFALIIIFISTVVFISTKINTLFKQPLETNIELFISSKPYSRFKIIFSKFLVLFVVTIFFSLFLMFGSIVVAYLDKNSFTGEKWRFISSILLGTIIISLFVIPIISFFSLFISANGLIAISSLVAVVIPLFNFVAINISGSTEIYNQINKNKFTDANTNYSSVDDFSNSNVFMSSGSKLENESYDQHFDSIYNGLVYVDLWHQASIFYGMFQTKDDYQDKKWIKKTEKFNDPSALSFTIDGEKITPIFSNVRYSTTEDALQAISNEPLLNSTLISHASEINSMSLMQQLIFVNNLIKQPRNNLPFNIFVQNLITSAQSSTLSDFQLVDKYSYYMWSNLIQEKVINLPNSVGFKTQDALDNSTRYDLLLVSNNDNIVQFISKPYINSIGLTTFWISLIIIANVTIIYLYTKRDIK